MTTGLFFRKSAEEQLKAQTDVSKASIRKAVEKLVAMNILTIGRGWDLC
ncbi:MAG: hypothetical protein LUD07_02915 [Clostridiales bacterium]|nr:hypothetical protein [Clostridiales bacterium]